MNPRGPVFVAGLERTGTSLMFALLASHPNLAMTRRTNLWTYFFDRYGDLADAGNLERCLQTMARYKRLVVLHPDWARIREAFRDGDPSYGRLFEVLESQYAERLGKPRWGDKSLNTERYADPIMESYAGARILHMVRDPRDRFASVMARWKVRRGGAGAGTAEWLSSVKLAERNLRHHPGQYLIVRYEDLASAPEPTLREVCAFIGEEFAPQMIGMEGAEAFRDQGSNSSYGARDVGVISTESIGRFAQVLSPRQIAFIQTFARKRMISLGYSPQPVELGLEDKTRLLAVDMPLELGRLVAWNARHEVQNRAGRTVPGYRLVEGAA
jgi:hypothetical protein